MSYFFSLSLKYMKRNKTRTLYSIFGIILVFILCYVTMSIGYAAWDYSFYEDYLSDPYELYTMADYCEEEPQGYFSQELIIFPDLKDTLIKLENDSRVEKINITKLNPNHKEIEISDLQETDAVRIRIRLKSTKALKKTAEELSKDYGLELTAFQSALMYHGQSDAESILFLNCVLILIASIFGMLSAFILRNTMTIAVTERVRDYGVFRCVGMSEWQLRLLLFAEGITMSIIASVFGVLLGFGGLKLLEPWIRDTLSLSSNFGFRLYPMAAVYTALLCIAVTLFSLIEPSRLAGKVAPVEALKGIYTAFEKKRAIKKLDKKGGIPGRLFKTAGLYAHRNIHRKKGGTASVFSIMFFCIVFILTVFSFT
ncbi:MAG: ABC transporter permease, partial [Lachnospiraceae bacterium]|nr:ABC transporter permease [Lachnospiraceae bacterium]